MVIEKTDLQKYSNLSGVNNKIAQTKGENKVKVSLSWHLLFGLYHIALKTTQI